jgi:multidrug transporter EmrE-like cation transporter
MSLTLSSFFDATFTNVILLSIVEIFGDFHLQKYAHTNNINYLVGGVTGYIGVIYFIIKSLQTSNILYVNLMWDGVSALINTSAAMIILGQRFESWEHLVGGSLIIIGLILIKLKKTKSD